MIIEEVDGISNLSELELRCSTEAGIELGRASKQILHRNLRTFATSRAAGLITHSMKISLQFDIPSNTLIITIVAS